MKFQPPTTPILRLALPLALGCLLTAARAEEKEAHATPPALPPAQHAGVAAASAPHATPASAISADQAWQQLLEGNKRYVANAPQHTHQTAERRTEVASGQSPLAIVLTCSDSRVPPELIFDQGLGDLFVIRNAGNILDDHGLGSMEYAIEHLHVPLLIVMGHAQCGAVKAAVVGGAAPGRIRSIVEAIQPAVEAAKAQAGDPVDNAVRANVARVVGMIKRIEPILSEAVGSGKVKVIGARYDLASGRVEVLP